MSHAAYIHIPFCNRICPYCDFNKYVVKDQPIEKYLHDLDQEMRLTLTPLSGKQMKTIYVGGGTPSILTPDQLHSFFHSVHKHLYPNRLPDEFTMEINPETLTGEKVKVMKEWGVNRFSIGVQTFDPNLLKRLGRMHSNKDVYNCIEMAKKEGIHNISIDLMFGLPKQTVDTFNATLDLALDLEITHFSAYSLKIEEGTFFHTLWQKDKLPLPSEDEEVEMYQLLMEKMNSNGFLQYEISNFARIGYESQHNLTYWRNEEYYGFGAGAHDYVDKTRHANLGPLKDYCSSLEHGQLPYREIHHVTEDEAIEDEMIMGLRLLQGVSRKSFFRKYGVSIEERYAKQITDLTSKGLLLDDGERMYLSRKGILLGNEVFSSFLNA